jgi:hypothetical protein
VLILFEILNDLCDAKFIFKIIVFNLKILNHEIYPFLRILLEFCSFRLITNEISFPFISLWSFIIIIWNNHMGPILKIRTYLIYITSTPNLSHPIPCIERNYKTIIWVWDKNFLSYFQHPFSPLHDWFT